MFRQPLFALLAASFPFVSHAEPRSDVDAIAALIEETYYDLARAADIANGLRQSTANGDFDRYEDRGDLAVELSRRLRALDGHFDVRWNPAVVPQRLTPRAEASLPESRTNYGFASVERLHGNVAYVDLTYAAHIDFSAADSPARRSADATLAMCGDADAVIIDLRRNGGGSPAMVGYLVSAFVDPKADVYNTFHSRQGVTSERPREPYARPMLSVPLYVLISGRTGSAAEAIAFTLQSANRAVIVGERSGGAANPGGRFRTPLGYSVFISTGSPRNPLNGRNWEKDGVKPDVEVASERAVDRAHQLALEKVLAGSISGAERTDAQWVLESLRASAVTQPTRLSQHIAGQFGPYELESIDGVVRARRARWPAMTLRPLQEDHYYFENNPSRRIRLDREDGKVVAITVSDSDGNEQRLRQNGPE